MVQLAYMADICPQRSSSLDSRRSGRSGLSAASDSRHVSTLWSGRSRQVPLANSSFLEHELDDLRQLNLELEQKYLILEAHHETLQFVFSLSFIVMYKLTKGFEGCIQWTVASSTSRWYLSRSRWQTGLPCKTWRLSWCSILDKARLAGSFNERGWCYGSRQHLSAWKKSCISGCQRCDALCGNRWGCCCRWAQVFRDAPACKINLGTYG